MKEQSQNLLDNPMSEEKKEPRKVEDEIKETIQANAEVLIKTNAHAGDMIKIIEMKDAPQYNGRDGIERRK